MRIGPFRVVICVVCLCICLLAARLAYMQIFAFESYKKAADSNMYLSTPIKTQRGMIFDRRGVIMAGNKSEFSIRMYSYKCRDPKKSLERLLGVLNVSSDKRTALFKQLDEKPDEDIVISDKFSQADLAKFAELGGREYKLEAKSVRCYPMESLGAHILGYVGEADEEDLTGKNTQNYILGDIIGKDGVELSHETLLHGRSGFKVESVDVCGNSAGISSESAAVPGSDIYLSIDSELQKKAEEYLADTLDYLAYKNGERSGGCVIAMETDTGYVRALASLPSFNPNSFAKGISSELFSRLINDPCSPLLNRAVHSSYPPGSTFKLVTTAACLQEKIISPYSSFYCTGVYTVAGLPFNCFVRTGHGPLNLSECLGYSCDTVYYEIGPKLGVRRMDKYASSFGIGSKTGIDLMGENSGNLPTPEWKKKVFNEKWFPGDDANSSIGQGFVTASPLQMTVVAAAVANGGYIVKPSLIEKVKNNKTSEYQIIEPDIKRRVIVDPQYLKDICAGMRASVDFGTSAKSGGFELGMAGKTGTAENTPTDDNPRGLNHCWFTGYAPYYPYEGWKAPKLAVTVFLEKSGGYGGEISAPIAAKVLRQWNIIYSKSEKQNVKSEN